jgi:SAM-dependent methyltransferase
MSDGWDESARAWIASMGERGDWSREFVLDAAMLARIQGRGFGTALDVGCGEGRFCRVLQQRGVATIGVDPTEAMLEEARRRDPGGQYVLGKAEKLGFADGRFDLVVSYLSLIDIPDFRAAIREMVRVLKPGGTLLIASLTGFTTSCAAQGWVRDAEGRRLHYPVDRYLDEFAQWVAWRGIRIVNWHRPLGAYMTALLDAGLQLRCFQEPEPMGADAESTAIYRRAPWFLVMEWAKPWGVSALG